MRRRTFVKAGGMTALSGLLAGCASPSEGGDGTTEEPTESTTTTDGRTETATSDDSTTTGSGSYSVSMTPVGEVTFDGVPETAAVYMPGYADMLVALGHGDAVASVGQKSRFNTDYYDELDGVSVDESGMVDLVESGVSRETFLSIDADVHLIDPNWLLNVFDTISQEDIDVLEERNGPFFGNTIFRRTDEWHDYDYYTLYGAFEKVAEAFQETERFEALQSFHDDFVGRVESDRPSEGPRAALVWGGDDQPTSFSPYHLSGQGANKKPFHDLGVQDALKEAGVGALSTGNRSKIDYETLLEVDPEVLFVRGHENKTREEFENTVVSFMQDHDTASRVTAVENGDVFRGGPIYLGPTHHLFVTERFATALYPDSFEGELFDRDELADIVTS